MCINVLPLCVYARHVCRSLWSPEEEIESSGIGMWLLGTKQQVLFKSNQWP